MPRAFAQVDVAALQARMATVTGQATTADPAALRARIGQLERDLSSARSGAAPAALAAENASLREQLAAARARPPQIIEMPVLQAGEVAAVEQVITALQDMAGQLRRPADQLAAALAPAGRRIPAALPVTDPPAGYPPPDPGTGTDDQEDPAAGPLRRGERKMLEVMARMYPLQLTQPQLGTLAGFAASGGTFGNYLRTLRRRGLAGVTGKHVLLTAAGQAVTGPATLAPVTAQEIRDMWAGPLRAGERAMLDVLIARYPGPVTPAELAEATGFAAAGGTFGNYLRTLKRNGLAEEVPGGIRADSVFFLDPAGV